MTSSAPRILGLDLGRKRIGAALSDPLGLTAQPLLVIERVGARKDLNAVAALAREHSVAVIVAGLPRLLSGEEGEAAGAARGFVARLGGLLPGVRMEFWDERMTTREAERVMIGANVRRARRKTKVDAVAAALILQGYLDSGAGAETGACR